MYKIKRGIFGVHLLGFNKVLNSWFFMQLVPPGIQLRVPIYGNLFSHAFTTTTVSTPLVFLKELLLKHHQHFSSGGITLPPRKAPSAVMITFGLQSIERLANASGKNHQNDRVNRSYTGTGQHRNCKLGNIWQIKNTIAFVDT